MNLSALKMRLEDITDLIAENRSADAIAEVFDIVDDINDELNPQPTLAYHSPAKDNTCDGNSPRGWSDGKIGDKR